MRSRTQLLSMLAALIPAVPAAAGELGHWSFEEGAFAGYGAGSLSILDQSGLKNHGYCPSPDSRVSYTTDAYSGNYALEFNNPLSDKPLTGVIVFPRSASLEPAKGYIEARVKIAQYHDARILHQSTFQFVRTEPTPPVYTINNEPRIVGRTAYWLGLQADGRVIGMVANDDPSLGPWTTVTSPNLLLLDQWNRIAMHWDGYELRVFLNGVWSQPVAYDSVPGSGLSYHASDVDPTYGPLTLDPAVGNSGAGFVGILDDLKIGCEPPCGAGGQVRRALR